MAYALSELCGYGVIFPIGVAVVLFLLYVTGRQSRNELRGSTMIMAVIATLPWLFFWGWYIATYIQNSGDLTLIMDQLIQQWWSWPITIFVLATPTTYLCAFILFSVSFFTPNE